jgi:hypothetical protein
VARAYFYVLICVLSRYGTYREAARSSAGDRRSRCCRSLIAARGSGAAAAGLPRLDWRCLVPVGRVGPSPAHQR